MGGCAIISAWGGQPLAALNSDVSMAVQPAQNLRFMQPQAFPAWSPRSQRVLPPRASTRQNEVELQDELVKMERQMGKQGRREMMAGLAAAAGLESQKARAKEGFREVGQGSGFPYWFV